MAFTIQLTGVIKVGSNLATMSIAPSVTTCEEFHKIKQYLAIAVAQTLNIGGLTNVDFCYLQFTDSSTGDPTHALVVPLGIGSNDASVSAHQTEFLYVNKTGTGATGFDIDTIATCYVEGIIGGAA